MLLTRHLVPAGIWLLILTYCSLTVPPSLPDFNLLRLDKFIHFGIYGLLCLLILGGLQMSGKRLDVATIIKSVCAAATWGILLEVCQAFLPYRTYELDDMVANTMGSALAPPFYWLMRKMGFK
jgi:VanZ family protein